MKFLQSPYNFFIVVSSLSIVITIFLILSIHQNVEKQWEIEEMKKRVTTKQLNVIANPTDREGEAIPYEIASSHPHLALPDVSLLAMTYKWYRYSFIPIVDEFAKQASRTVGYA